MHGRRRVPPLAVALLGAIGFAACSGNTSTTGPAAARIPLQISNIAATANPLNVLSTIITFAAPGADSARVVYSTPGDTIAATPFSPIVGDSGRVVTLGLLPNSTYAMSIEVVGGNKRIAATGQFFTGALPPRVQAASLVPTGTFSRGYTLVSPLALLPTTDSAIAVAFDAVGRIRWYRLFPGTGSAESKMQANGHFTVALGISSGFDERPAKFVELLPSGEIVGTYTAGSGEFTDIHELLMTGTPSAPILHLFGYSVRPFDFSPLGGPTTGIGVGHQLLRTTPDGTVQFKWDAWDHYSIADWIEPVGVDPPNDFDHPNSIDFDLDSNYIVSFRHMGAIVKLDAKTGATIWQLGGRLNQFTIRGDPLNFFSAQHCVRVLPNGHLLIYDNGLRHTPAHTRAVEYALDEANKTATMVWEYEPQAPMLTTAFGSVQRLANGNTLVGFGFAGQIHEVDARSHLVAIATFEYGEQNTFYRAIRLASLYQYARP
jgi:arylsulfate sulfotransferase